MLLADSGSFLSVYLAELIQSFLYSSHSDVPSNITDMRLKDRLEEEFEEGLLAVERSGTCAGFEWTVTWETSGGDHPEMQVNGDSLSGNEVSISVQTIQNGGLFLEPIPGEFLRTPHSSGQVSSLSCQTSMRVIIERGFIAFLSHYCSSPLFCLPF